MLKKWLFDNFLEKVVRNRLIPCQHTIAREVRLSGKGLFTGSSVHLELKPSAPNSGIVFHRKDLGSEAKVPANFRYVFSTFRSTCLEKNGVRILMVEHLLSALKAFGIDNVEVVLTAPEVPSGDGSASLFVDLLEKAGKVSQDALRKVWKVHQPVYWTNHKAHLVALPSEDFQISYTLHYPDSKILESQYFSHVLEKNRYVEEISQCRTFALQEEVDGLMKKGLLLEAGLENGILIRDDAVMNEGGLRFSTEMARHKILDLIGDIALLGYHLHTHIIAICSGHEAHVAFNHRLHDSMERLACAN